MKAGNFDAPLPRTRVHMPTSVYTCTYTHLHTDAQALSHVQTYRERGETEVHRDTKTQTCVSTISLSSLGPWQSWKGARDGARVVGMGTCPGLWLPVFGTL